LKYAILESGGKQYTAREGETIEVDRLPMEVGDAVTFDDVLLVVEDGSPIIGKPYIKGAKVEGEVVDQFRGPKIIVFKFKPKVRYRKKQGHRQHYTRVALKNISIPGSKGTSGGAKKSKSQEKPAEGEAEAKE
jgi:large subunit ribosomal protein L21